jgi:hypothetical protein
VAALIEAARAARLEAQRLRTEERRLRIKLRANRAIQDEMMAAAAAAAAARAVQRERTLPSPWSELQWRHADLQLEQTLVALS